MSIVLNFDDNQQMQPLPEKKKTRKREKRPTNIMNPGTGRMVSLTQFLKRYKEDFQWDKQKKRLEYIGNDIEKEYAYLDNQLIETGTRYYNSLGRDKQEEIRRGIKILVDRKETKVKNPISKRDIEVNGRTFKNMLNVGYVYERKKNILHVPITEQVAKKITINEPMQDEAWQELLDYSKTLIGKGARFKRNGGFLTFNCTLIDSKRNYKEKISPEAVAINEMRKIRDVIYDYGWLFQYNKYKSEQKANTKNLKLEVTITQTKYDPNLKYKIGPALFSYNGRCVQDAFLKLCETYKTIKGSYGLIDWDKYEDCGVFIEDFEKISRKLKCKISIYTPIDDEPIMAFGVHNLSRVTHIKFIYNNNHVEVYKKSNEKEVEEMEEEELNKLYLQELDKRTVLYTKGKYPEIYYFETFDKIYRATYRDVGGMQEFKELNTHISPIRRTHINIESIKTILKHGIHLNNGDVTSNQYYHYDLKKAYLNYYKYECFKSLPCNLDLCLDAEKITDDELNHIIENREGVMLLEMECLYYGHIIKRWVSMQYVRHYKKNRPNDYFKPIQIMLATCTTDKLVFPTNSDYRILIGLMGKHIQKWYIPTTDPVYANTLMKNRAVSLNDDDMYLCSYRFDLTNNNYFPHIACYIQNATECEIEKLYIQNNMNISELRRINVDSIISTRPLHFDSEIFHSDKDIMLLPYSNEVEYPDIKEGIKCGSYYDDLLFNKTISIITGSPGTGKSYTLRQMYSTISNCKILVPTLELKKFYSDLNVQTIQSFISRSKKNENSTKISCILIDEYSMINNDMFENLKSIVDEKTNIYLFGDLSQIKPYTGLPIPRNLYYTHELTTNYRQNSTEFKQKINDCLLNGEYDFTEKQKITLRYALKNDIIILSSNHKQIDYINDVAINKLKKTERIPVRIYKSSNGFLACEIDYIINYNDDSEEYKFESGRSMNRKIFHEHNKFGFAITYHTMQGKTVHKPQRICISTDNLFDESMLYVGVSRVQDEEQLFVLK